MRLPDLDTSFARVVAQLPARVRAEASRLPGTLGFRSSSWHDFARLEPVIDLPGMVGPSKGLAAARFAHHCGGFWGLTRDRVSDGQVLRPVSANLQRGLRQVWRDACCTEGIDEVVRRTERAFRDEARARASQSRSAAEYLSTSWWKVSWFPVATVAWLKRASPSADVVSFTCAVACMMLSLQLADDAVDERQDRLRHGTSVPEQLGCDRVALAAGAIALSEAAAARFKTAGFATLAAWHKDRSRALRRFFGRVSAKG